METAVSIHATSSVTEEQEARAPLQVGLVGTAYPPIMGGMEVYLQRIAQALAIDGHDVTVATRFRTERPPSMQSLHGGAEARDTRTEDGVHVHRVAPSIVGRQLLRPVHRLHFREATRPLADALMWRAFARPLSEALAGADLLHYSGTGREMLGFTVARLAKRWRVPLVVTPHTHAGVWGDGPIDLALYSQADRIIALTEDERDRLVSLGVQRDRLLVLGHGVSVTGKGDGHRFRERHGIEGPIVLFIGRKATYKGYPLLLEAVSEVWAHRPDVHFVFAGPDDPGETFGSLPRDSRILDLGLISDSEREDAYAACDIFCLPSEAEAYGLVYLEAWAYKKPVVALRIPTLVELVGSSGGGLLVSRSAGAVAEALVGLTNDTDQRLRLGEAGHAVAKRQTWAGVAEHLAETYTGLVERSPVRVDHLAR